jgi:hypothetical protein
MPGEDHGDPSNDDHGVSSDHHEPSSDRRHPSSDGDVPQADDLSMDPLSRAYGELIRQGVLVSRRDDRSNGRNMATSFRAWQLPSCK